MRKRHGLGSRERQRRGHTSCGLYTPFTSTRDEGHQQALREGPSVGIGTNYRIAGAENLGCHQPPEEGTNSAITRNWRFLGARDLEQQQACSLGPSITLVGRDCGIAGRGASSSREGVLR